MFKKNIKSLIIFCLCLTFLGCASLEKSESILISNTSTIQTTQTQSTSAISTSTNSTQNNIYEEDDFYKQITTHTSSNIDEVSVAIGVNKMTLFSGIIIDEVNGKLYILTCKHGFENAGNFDTYDISLQFNDGTMIEENIKPILYDGDDLALIKVNHHLSSNVKAVSLCKDNYNSDEYVEGFIFKNCITNTIVDTQNFAHRLSTLPTMGHFSYTLKDDVILDGASGAGILTNKGYLAGILHSAAGKILTNVQLSEILLFLKEI